MHLTSLKNKGFTLIELLVVVAIIGILAAVVIASLNITRIKGSIAAGQQFDSHTFSALGADALGVWNFDEGSGTTTADFSGDGSNDVITNGSWVNGIQGGAISFSGTGYVSAGTMNVSNQITVSAWIYTGNPGQNGFIIGKNPVNSQWELFLAGGLLIWRGGTAGNLTTCTAPSANQWHNVAASQNGSVAKVYIDGRECVSGAAGIIGNDNTNTVEIGRFFNGYYFTGYIDQVRVYSGSLF